jgi:hypothetical protein
VLAKLMQAGGKDPSIGRSWTGIAVRSFYYFDLIFLAKSNTRWLCATFLRLLLGNQNVGAQADVWAKNRLNWQAEASPSRHIRNPSLKHVP